MRIVIPLSLQTEIRQRPHTGHMGIEKTKARARVTVYWPGLDSEISDMITNCSTCIEFHSTQKNGPRSDQNN